MVQYYSNTPYVPQGYYRSVTPVFMPNFQSVSLAYDPTMYQTSNHTQTGDTVAAGQAGQGIQRAQKGPEIKKSGGFGLLAAACIAYLTLTSGK